LILVDTNILVGLVDARDSHHDRAARDLRRTQRVAILVTEAVLSEACFLLPGRWARRRLRFLLGALSVRRLVLEESWQNEIFEWLDSYGSHHPDFADAQLAVAASQETRLRVWTYDSEFKTTWRRTDGSRIPLFGS
jgi:predicted nucleic acid-binding protein